MTTTSPATRNRPAAATAALWVLQVLLAVVFALIALPKMLGNPIAVDPFDLVGIGIPGMIIVGWLEFAGAIALLVPRLCGLASVCQVPLMVGATVLTAVQDPELVTIPAITLVLVCVVAWFRRRDTAALVRAVRRR
ncbi:DoxX family protein [Saccharopolyspora sp. NPDC047091]|uniref:DoxX family protein n=1 Tax=Saccharopolyspora sp. NPDC047091 TaxID=3155924 RepID=UPI0034064F3C